HKNNDMAGVFCSRGRAFASYAACFLEVRQRLRVDVVSLYAVAGFYQTSGYVTAHNAQADESDGLLCHVMLVLDGRKTAAGGWTVGIYLFQPCPNLPGYCFRRDAIALVQGGQDAGGKKAVRQG